MHVVRFDVFDLISVLDASFVPIRSKFELLEQVDIEIALVDELADGLALIVDLLEPEQVNLRRKIRLRVLHSHRVLMHTQDVVGASSQIDGSLVKTCLVSGLPGLANSQHFDLFGCSVLEEDSTCALELSGKEEELIGVGEEPRPCISVVIAVKTGKLFVITRVLLDTLN